MPTVILLDVSLSMCRSLSEHNGADGSIEIKDKVAHDEVRQLANVGLGVLLDYFAQNSQLEHTALVVFSSLWEVRHDFTRNYEAIKNGIYDLELYDKSNIVNAVRGLLSLKLNEWAQDGIINIILITDGQYRPHKKFRGKSKSNDEFNDVSLSSLRNQFDFPCKLQVVCLASLNDPALKTSLDFYKRLVFTVDNKSRNCPVLSASNMRQFKESAIWLPDSTNRDISIESVETLFAALAEAHYKPYHSTISCGHLSTMVLLSPKLNDYVVEAAKNDFGNINDKLSNPESNTAMTSLNLSLLQDSIFVRNLKKARLFKLNEGIDICGFLPLSELSNPAVVSRHLVLPVGDSQFDETQKAQQILTQDSKVHKFGSSGPIVQSFIDNGIDSKPSKIPAHIEFGKTKSSNSAPHDTSQDLDITKQPSFCVLLHNSLKQENMVAVCMVGKNEETDEDWFAVLHPHVDSKKKSGLILSLLLPGNQPILWLPNFKTMGSMCLNSDATPTIMDRPLNSRSLSKSYSSNTVIWLDQDSVQADILKVLRYARRGLDKAPQFYKEVNRIRRAALSYGFFDVLTNLANTLEKEKRLIMTDSSRLANQGMLQHIDHVISNLRARLSEESYDIMILPTT